MNINFRMFAAALALAALSTGSAEAGWGRYRVSTFYGTPSTPVIRETVVVRGAYRPVVVAPAPLVVAPAIVEQAPVTAYYTPPAVYVPAPRAVRAAYYAPAVAPVYVAPAPGIYYDRGFPRVILAP